MPNWCLVSLTLFWTVSASPLAVQEAADVQIKGDASPEVISQASDQNSAPMAETIEEPEAQEVPEPTEEELRLAEIDSFIEELVKLSPTDRITIADDRFVKAQRDLAVLRIGDSQGQIILAVARARSASHRQDRRILTSAWNDAINSLHRLADNETLLAMNMEAADALKQARLYSAAAKVLDEAANLVPPRTSRVSVAWFELQYERIAALAQDEDWRRIAHRLEDMEAYADEHLNWSLPRFVRNLREIDIRLAFEPDSNERLIRIRELFASADLIKDMLGARLPAKWRDEYRELGYRLEDADLKPPRVTAYRRR